MGLAGVALALSAFLSWHYLTGRSMIGCGGGSPCNQVLSSRWSSVGGVLPVSGLAAGAYLAMLVASFFIGPRTAEPDRRLAWGAMLILSGAAAGSAAWFIFVQEHFIGALCPYCMATHVTGLLLSAIVISQAWRQRTNQDVRPERIDSAAADLPRSPRRLIGTFPAIALPLLGIALAGAMAALQVGFAPPGVYRGGESQSAAASALDPHAVPLIGSPDAPYIVTLLFDYQCPHCQRLHAMLEDVMQRYHGKVAFILCPAPLNNQCNPYIARETAEFKDSCDLAKIGLAVFAAKRDAFTAFDTWMFSADPGHDLWSPRSLDAARAKAIELVGQAKFDAAQTDPWVDEYLQTSVRIFGQSINPDQSGSAVPKLVFGSHWVTPEPQSADDLVVILQKSLELPKP